MAQQIQTLSSNPNSLSGWTISQELIESWANSSEIDAANEMRPCGCGIKIDLQDIVYPALRETAEMGLPGVTGFGIRVDACVSEGQLEARKRILVKVSELSRRKQEIAKEIASFGTDSVIELFSTDHPYFENREGMRETFRKISSEKSQIFVDAASRLKSQKGPDFQLRYGKGHSILAGGDFILFELLKHKSSPGFTVVNNDTIVTADSLLRHWSKLSVFTALNNALNDLFLMGVTEGIKVAAVYDGDKDECLKIQEALQDYQTFMRERGADLEILDQGPLNVGTRLIGASVIGRAMHELPTLKGLSSGQEIIATRHLGDLSFLSMNRASYFPEKRKGEDNAIRLSVLQRFATPNLLLARKIRAYLPDLGKKFDPDRHIFFATDISGPGLAVLEEGANASGVDVRIDDMKFLDERSLKFYRKNQTSSTNGPILLAASRSVIEQIQSDLHASGYSETWRVGSVLGPSAKPCIELASNLEKRFASNNPRTDFFRPEVHFGEKGESKERVPIFQRFRFKN